MKKIKNIFMLLVACCVLSACDAAQLNVETTETIENSTDAKSQISSMITLTESTSTDTTGGCENVFYPFELLTIETITDDCQEISYKVKLCSRYINDDLRMSNIKLVIDQPLAISIRDLDMDNASVMDFYSDFDNNGTYESFVSRSFGTEFDHYSELWYVANSKCEIISANFNRNTWYTSVDNSLEVVTVTCNESRNEYPYAVYAYTVKNGTPVQIMYKDNVSIYWDQCLVTTENGIQRTIALNELDFREITP